MATERSAADPAARLTPRAAALAAMAVGAILAACLAAAIFCLEPEPEAVRLSPGTPFFSAPDVDAPIIAVAEEVMDVPVSGGQVLVRLLKNPFFGKNPHWRPLQARPVFHRTQLPDGRAAWVSPHLVLSPGSGRIMPVSVPMRILIYPLCVACALLAIALLASLRFGWLRMAFLDGRGDWRHVTAGLALVLGIRTTLFLHIMFLAGTTRVYPTDEHGYYEIACDLLGGHIADVIWKYTIGMGLLDLPFAWLSGAKDFEGVESAICLFNSLVAAPASLVLAYLIVRNLSNSCRKAALAVLAVVAVPFVYHAAEGVRVGVFDAVLTSGECNPAAYGLYYLLLATGHNGMSDTPSTALVLLCVWMALSSPARRGWIFAAPPALFAFACLVRISNIMFAPLMAYLLWESAVRRGEAGAGALLRRALLAVGVFLAVFSPQLAANALQHGGLLRFPYVLHPNRASEGFSVAFLPDGIAFLIGCNYLPMAIGAAGLVLLAFRAMASRPPARTPGAVPDGRPPLDADRRTFIVLALTAAPIILFYCGYPCVEASPTRFILTAYPALYAAAACGWPKRSAGWSAAWTVAACVALQALLSPSIAGKDVLRWELELWSWPSSDMAHLALSLRISALTATAAACAWLAFRRRWSHMATLLLFTGIWQAGSPLALYALLALLALAATAAWMADAWRWTRESGKDEAVGDAAAARGA